MSNRLLILVLFLLSGCLFASPYASINSEPKMSFGLRQSIGHHGCDLSVGASKKHDENRYSAKSLYLFYPQPQKQVRTYIGGGLKGTMKDQRFPNYKVWKHAKKEHSYEGVVGCEWLRNNKMRVYTQAECSLAQSSKPQVRFSLGFGF